MHKAKQGSVVEGFSILSGDEAEIRSADRLANRVCRPTVGHKAGQPSHAMKGENTDKHI